MNRLTQHAVTWAMLLALACGLPGHAQSRISANTWRIDEDTKPASAKIQDLAWLAGYWRGEGLDGECEELWSQPVGDRMNGIFTLRKEGKIVFSEAMVLVEEGGSLVLKVKHFSADFVGWEEKDKSVRFPLVRVGENEAYFNGLTFRRTEKGSLSIYLVIRHQDKRTEHTFTLRRRDL